MTRVSSIPSSASSASPEPLHAQIDVHLAAQPASTGNGGKAPTKYLASDIPLASSDEDRFGVGSYVDSLCNFIRNSSTPLTVAIQGEWGSGKTSFMRMIESQLCDRRLPDTSRFDAIWLETWNLFLESDQEDAAKKLFISLVSQLSDHFDKPKSSQDSQRAEGIKRSIRTISTVALNMLNVETESVDRLWNTVGLDGPARSGRVSDVKKSLEQIIDSEVSAPDNGVTDKGFIIFVDDLDRLDPGMAVVLLETMKNLFDIRNCVFVLAVDFDVVKLGITQKYGRERINGRNVAQDFFDKIIQLPFNVPVSQYDVMPMITERLKAMRLLPEEWQYASLSRQIENIFLLTTNKNPRSIKNILNSLQIMVEMERRSSGVPEYRLMLLLLVAMHKAFPTTYALLSQTIQPVDDWGPMLSTLFDDSPQGQRNRDRVGQLLAIYADLYQECIDKGVPINPLFGTVNIMGGHDNASSHVRYNGERYDRTSQTQHKQGIKLIDDTDFSWLSGRRVLDVGCGNGRTTIEMWDENRDMIVSAIDLSEGQIKKAYENYDKHLTALDAAHGSSDGARASTYRGRINFRVEDAEQLSKRERYDLVFSNSALHWARRPKRTYTALFRALRPGGELAVHQGGHDTYRGLHANARLAIANLGFDDKFPEGWAFPAFYPTKTEMEGMLDSIGFEHIDVEEVESEDPNPLVLTNAFAVASLIFYRTEAMSDNEYEALEREFKRLCAEHLDTYTNRLYIHARKPR